MVHEELVFIISLQITTAEAGERDPVVHFGRLLV